MGTQFLSCSALIGERCSEILVRSLGLDERRILLNFVYDKLRRPRNTSHKAFIFLNQLNLQ